MAKDKDEKTEAAAPGQVPPMDEVARERAQREASGKNWEARHVADLIDLSELTVKRMARKGKIPAVKIGRGWEFPPAKVKAWYAGEPWKPPHWLPPGPKKKR
jgi:excisionase family DNA binding protein